MKTLFPLFLSVLLASSVLAKRAAPVEVAPVTVGNVVISAPSFCQVDGVPVRGGVIEARDSATGKLVWSVQVYQTKRDPALEGDVQDVFIKTLSHDATHDLLILSDERGRVFVVDLKSRKVTPVARGGASEKTEQSAGGKRE